jgi:hypothetical protein
MQISRAMIAAATVTSVIAAACKSDKPAPARATGSGSESGSAAPAPASAVDDTRFVIAKPAISTRAAPERFAAPLPTTLAELQRDDAYAPRVYLEAAIANGTAAVRQRVIAAVARAGADGVIEPELAAWYTGLFGYQPDPGTCDWITMAMAAAPDPAMQRVFAGGLTRCGLAVEKVMHLPETPDAVIVDWGFETEGFAYDARIVAAAVAFATTAEHEYETRKVGFVLARLGDEGVAAATRLRASIRDPERGATAMLGMLRSPTKAGRALGEAACTVLPNDAMCSGGAFEIPPPTIDDAIRGELTPELAAYPAADRIAAATRCIADDGPEACFLHLAALDRAAAVAQAKGRDTPAARALTAFPTAGALEAELDKLGFTQRGSRAPLLGVSADAELAARGRVTRFDTETGQFPNEHDGLLAELAVLAAPALDDVLFTEDAPRESQMDSGAYRLTAYAGGRAYRVDAQNLGDWYDMNAVIGLLNAVLVAKGSAMRFVVLPTGDQAAEVLVGPGSGITSLADRGLLTLAGADDARATGKAFEEEVIERMKKEGGGPVYRDVPVVPAKP